MLEFFEDNPSVSVQPEEYIRLLGYPPGYQLRERAKELAAMTKEWYMKNGRPWIYVRQAQTFSMNDESFIINQTEFQSSAVLDRFHKAETYDVFMVAVSAGKECEELAAKLWKEGKPDEYYFMEMFGSAVVEQLITQTSARLCAWADEQGLAVLPHYSPGYNAWDIRDQLKLIDLIKNPDSQADNLLVESLDSGMLKPKKSLLAIFGLTKKASKLTAYPGMVPCEKCALRNCGYRRKPYRYRMNAQSDTEEKENDSTLNGKSFYRIPDMNVNYSLNPRVLKKWAEERLSLTPSEDGSVEAQFVYDGTTCSNFGHPLQFVYRVRIANAEDGYKILSQECAPAASDEGHKKMCQFIKEGDRLIEKVAAEKPLLGKSINEIFEQEKVFSPSGCYCEPTSRSYKWNLVMEVIHFALSSPEVYLSAESKA